MKSLIAGGLAGLWLGMALKRCGLTEAQAVRAGVRLHNRTMNRTLLCTLGWGAVWTSFLMWLAVIDVDTLVVLPLSGATVLGGVVFGAAVGLSGVTAGTALGMTGGGRFREGLCAVAGGLAGAALPALTEPVRELAAGLTPEGAHTLFQVTLDEPFLFGGGFLGQGCLGALLLSCAALIRPERPSREQAQAAETAPADQSADVQDVREETPAASLAGEEPVIVDTKQNEADVQEKTEQEDSGEDRGDGDLSREEAAEKPTEKQEDSSGEKDNRE